VLLNPMITEPFDVVILGGGNAGIGVTGPARAAGLSVAMIEARDLGGTCPNRGCTPKKILVAAGHALDEIARAATHKISVSEPNLDWPALIDREQAMVAPIPSQLRASMQRRGVEIICGEGRFVAPDTVCVGDRCLAAKHIVIATGSKSRPLAFPGADHLVTSDHILADRILPRSAVFIGGGVISLELGHVYARAGVEVIVLEALPRLLPAIEQAAVEKLLAECERIGLRILTGVDVLRIEKRDNGQLQVVFRHQGHEQGIVTGRAVNGAGRIANVDNLDLAAGNVAHANGRITLDPWLRSVSNPRVYVCGDAVPGTPQLSPVATYEGSLVGRNIAEGARDTPNYDALATSVYTVPALASVGLTEQAAREKGHRIRVRDTDMRGWLSSLTYAETAAWARIITDEASGLVLGAHLVGHAAEELINLFALAIEHRIPAASLKNRIYAYPTFSSDIKNLL